MSHLQHIDIFIRLWAQSPSIIVSTSAKVLIDLLVNTCIQFSVSYTYTCPSYLFLSGMGMHPLSSATKGVKE